VVKKNVAAAAASMSSIEAFPTVGLALQLEVPIAAAASIQLKAVAANIQLESAVEATLETARLWETLPTASRVLGPYENPVT
jgi:hypothetical protein